VASFARGPIIIKVVERLNSEGIPRYHLSLALKDRKLVSTARRINTCLLCRRKPVNESGLCEVCYGMLDGEELKLACKWLTGEGP
jgi:hypothetical protein